MALDNANFIAELSITDPPGTDPLSQGDDQIRTIKRATQQSFPFVDKEVSLTADQMNLAAIKNEANTFSVQNQSFVDENLIRRSLISTFPRWRYVDELSQVQWETYMAAGPGNNFLIQRRFDGTFVDVPISIGWTTGVVDFAHVPTVQGAPLWIAGEIRQFAIAASPGTNWFLADGTNGTANLADRWLVGAGSFAGGVGSNLNASLDALTVANTTGSTAISTAQMPVHNHNLRGGSATGVTDQAVGAVSNETVTGANRGNSAGTYVNLNSSGNRYIDNAGSGSGHTHSSPAQDVVAQNPTFTGSVQPVSFAVETYQYVP